MTSKVSIVTVVREMFTLRDLLKTPQQKKALYKLMSVIDKYISSLLTEQ